MVKDWLKKKEKKYKIEKGKYKFKTIHEGDYKQETCLNPRTNPICYVSPNVHDAKLVLIFHVLDLSSKKKLNTK